eukprot:2234125-Rhodomonas_salina.4
MISLRQSAQHAGPTARGRLMQLKTTLHAPATLTRRSYSQLQITGIAPPNNGLGRDATGSSYPPPPRLRLPAARAPPSSTARFFSLPPAPAVSCWPSAS